MGISDWFKRTKKEAPVASQKQIIVGASQDMQEIFQSYTNSNITFSGSLSGYDYDAILRDKQTNIVSLYQLADYYSDADPIVKGIIHHVFVPFSASSPWRLSGNNNKTLKLYEDQYSHMRLKEKINGIFLEYWKYSNVVMYLLNGQLITLPIHKCRIGNMTLNGLPLVDFDCQSIETEWRTRGYSIYEGWINDNELEDYFKGYPEEVREALNKGAQYCQLNPENTFVMQGNKESWMRYAIPFIASCLEPLAKKELISNYEKATLNLATRGFVHVQYGDDKKGQDMLPDANQLRQLASIFRSGMSNFPLVVTNYLAKAQFVQANVDDLYQFDKYRDVNNDILSAGGVSGIVVSGLSQDGSTFASAQISMQTVEARINDARDKFCDLMDRINERLTEVIPGTYNLKETPKFTFAPLSMEGKKALREACKELWNQGVVSTTTYLDTFGYSIHKETELRKNEKNNEDDILTPRNMSSNSSNTSGKSDAGRPKVDDSDRKSDPDAAERSKAPKPSNPEGSMDDS